MRLLRHKPYFLILTIGRILYQYFILGYYNIVYLSFFILKKCFNIEIFNNMS